MTAREELIDVVTRRLVADEDIHAYADTDLVDDRLSTVVAAVADALIEEGWRPPQPEATAWQISVRVPASLPGELRADLFERVAAVVHDWEPEDRDGWDVDLSGHPGEYLWEENQRLRGLIGDLDREKAAAKDAPLPDTETEWGWRAPESWGGAATRVGPEKRARERANAARGRTLIRREVGPWTEVQPAPGPGCYPPVDGWDGVSTARPRRCPAVTPEGDLITEGRQCQQYEGHAHDHTWYGDNGHAYSAWTEVQP